MATWLATTGAGLILGFLAKIVIGWITAKNDAGDAYRRGADDVATKVNQETTDADRRAAQRQADTPVGARLDDDLASGRVRF